MKVGVGSKNKTKVSAVAELLKGYPMFEKAEVVSVDVKVEEFGHPKSMEETVAGAINRAEQAYFENDYGFGIEGGLVKVPKTKSGYMGFTVCAIFDGKQVHLGFSQAYEWPKKAMEAILLKGMDGSQAMKATGLSNHEKAGEHEGLVSVLTKGRTNRTELNKGAIMMALIHLENPELY